MLFFVTTIFAQIKVFHLSDTTVEIKKNNLIYSLPMAEIKIKVVTETEYFFPGPYNKFADKYLTIKGASNEASQFSEIKDVSFLPFYNADPKSSFIISSKKPVAAISFAQNGMILNYGEISIPQNNVQNDYYLNIPEYLNTSHLFPDMSIKRNFSNITDTTYKVVQIDSIFQKIPIYNKTITSKEFEQKAEEAANFVIKIRKRKFKLMAGLFDSETPPKNVDRMIAELDSLEAKYLQLFTGKTEKITNEYYFTIIPNANIKEQKITLFRIDEQDNNPIPVYLEISNSETFSEVELFYQRQEKLHKKDKTKGLYYRIPGYGVVKVTALNHIYAEQTIMIPQYGYLNYLPAKMFKNKKLKVIFDEKSGSIKTISNE